MAKDTRRRPKSLKPNYRFDLDVRRLERVSPALVKQTKGDLRVRAVFRDPPRGWSIQVYEPVPGLKGTTWENLLPVAIKHCKGRTQEELMSESEEFAIPVTWDEKQAIKNHLFDPQCAAFEYFPPADDLVNIAPISWLWVLPAGVKLPVNLGPAIHNNPPMGPIDNKPDGPTDKPDAGQESPGSETIKLGTARIKMNLKG